MDHFLVTSKGCQCEHPIRLKFVLVVHRQECVKQQCTETTRGTKPHGPASLEKGEQALMGKMRIASVKVACFPQSFSV